MRAWNWKSAVLSSLSRSTLFFFANLPAGRSAATSALVTELVFRFVTAGFYGALTQELRRIEPQWRGIAAGMSLLPLATHSLEFAVHRLRGTAELSRSIALSVALTALTTAFNVFAMRRGALVVGHGSNSLGSDLARLPRLIFEFAAAVAGMLRRGISTHPR